MDNIGICNKGKRVAYIYELAAMCESALVERVPYRKKCATRKRSRQEKCNIFLNCTYKC